MAAPLKIRKEWIGLTFSSKKAKLQKVEERGCFFRKDFVKTIYRGVYSIPLKQALDALCEKSPKAVQWFLNHWIALPATFNFGISEVKKIEEFYASVEEEETVRYLYW